MSRLRAAVVVGLLNVACGPSGTPPLDVLPQHFLLHPGERIHYTAVARSAEGESQTADDLTFTVQDPQVVRLVNPTGLFEAVGVGRTELVVSAATAKRRIAVEVAGQPQPPMDAVHHSAPSEIAAEELLFVGHANLDGFDHTAVAKPGIDRLVSEAKKDGVPVVYWSARRALTPLYVKTLSQAALLTS